MPVTLRSVPMRYKNPKTGDYVPFNSIKGEPGRDSVAAELGSRVTALNNSEFVIGSVVEVIGIPVYISNAEFANYPGYSISTPGWYVFARVTPPEGSTVRNAVVSGAAGFIISAADGYIDLAVRFEVAAQSSTVTITYADQQTETFVFRAVDLAISNLDYRTSAIGTVPSGKTIQGQIADNASDIVDLKSALSEATEETDNLFWFTDTETFTKNDLTFTFLDKSTVKVHGTCSANTYLQIRGATSDQAASVPAGTYIYDITLLSGTGKVNKLRTGPTAATALNMNEAFTFAEDSNLLFTIRKDQVCDNAVYQIMMNAGSTLKPYVTAGITAVDDVARAEAESAYKLIPNQPLIIFGDSWTVPAQDTVKWIDYVAQELQLELRNYAVSGTGYKNGSSSWFGKRINDKMIGINANYTGLVVIFGSGNDCQHMADYAGTSADMYDPIEGTGDTVGGRINYAFASMKSKAPLAKVLIVGPCPWQIYPPTNTSNSMIQYIALLKECCEKAGFVFVDMYYKSGLRPWDDTQANLWVEQSPSNRVHPNGDGHYFLYPQLRDVITAMLPNVASVS